MKLSIALGLPIVCLVLASSVHADETCMSPYMAKIVGQEDFVYIWTLGMEGIGDEQDKMVTVDVNPSSPRYGQVVDSVSVGGRNEAHHSGLTDDRRHLWASGLDTSKIFIFDIHSDPGAPRLTKTVGRFRREKRRRGRPPHQLCATRAHDDHRFVEQPRPRRPHRAG